jgi:hypothetical protein
MFNFKKLKLIKTTCTNSTNSFVGIRRGTDQTLEFTLPRGFENFPEGDFNNTKQLFFKMYQTFKKFEKTLTTHHIDKTSAQRDNIEIDGNAYIFKDSEENDVILYSKISMIEKMLEAYQDLSLDFIEKSIGTSDKINYEKIDSYLDKAIYLDNDAIHIDEMEVDRHILHYQPNSLINLFCFIIRELEKELGGKTEPRINDLANIFIDYNLSPDQSLFEESTFESTISTLKDILHEIDKTTSYKDSRYWQLFESIESFLYGELNMETTHEDGTFWGINNFFQVWEDMCNTYAFSKFSIAYADTNIIYHGQRVGNHKIGGHSVFKLEDLTYPFFIKFREETRWMRPDLVIFSKKTPKRTVFDKEISIVLKNKYGTTGDYEIKLNDESAADLHKKFCSDLKKVKTRGARPVRGNIFKNYPTATIEHQKKIFCSNLEIKSTIPAKAKIIDWKYMDLQEFFRKNKKIESDINKQLCYEHCLKTCDSFKVEDAIENWFAIPFFNQKQNEVHPDFEELQDYTEVHDKIIHNEIKIYKFSFSAIQTAYLENDSQHR